MIKDIIKDKFMSFALAASAMTMLAGCSADITDTATTTRTVTATIECRQSLRNYKCRGFICV